MSGLQWQFDASGQLTTISEPNGNRITLGYSGANLTLLSHSNGQQFTLEYNGQGRISRLTDHAGRATVYSYDGSGLYLQQVTAPGGLSTSYSYTGASNTLADHALREIAYADGTHRSFSYDEAGRLTATWRDGDAERVSYAYDAFGTVTVSDEAGNSSVLHRGSAGQPLQVENALGEQVRFAYDANFNLTGAQLPDGSQAAIGYDGRGNAVRAQDARDSTTSAAYTDAFNRLNWLRDARGNLTDFSYDADGNLTAITAPDSSVQGFAYDGAGNLISSTNRRGATISYGYNAAGQVTSKTYPDGKQISYSYDAVGRLIGVSDAAGTISLSYDVRDLLTSISYPSGRTLSYSYDNAGRRTGMTSDDGYALNYAYDTAGRLARLTDGTGAEIIRYEYDSVGRLSREIKGNGTTSSYSYDAAGQLTSIVHRAPDSSVQARFDYSYDAVGNRTAQTTLDGTTSYSYDATGQLIGVTYPDGSSERYTYDAVGNRMIVSDGTSIVNYVTNDLNQYTQVGNTAYEYDADGNLTAKVAGSQRTTYSYDSENRLIGVAEPGGSTWSYSYDALGNRQSVAQNGVVTSYLNDPTGMVDVVAAYAGNGSLTNRYLHGLGLVAQRDAAASSAYYNFDATGHTRQLTNQAGAVANRYTYTPFGESLQANETIANPFRYVGRFGVMDEGNGLQFMRARYYDADLGRFSAEDPIGFLGGDVNLYGYVRNQPISIIDPLGLIPKSIDKNRDLKEEDRYVGLFGDRDEYYLQIHGPIDLRHYEAARQLSQRFNSNPFCQISFYFGADCLVPLRPDEAFIAITFTNLAGWVVEHFVQEGHPSSYDPWDFVSNFVGSIAGSIGIDFYQTRIIRPIDPNDKLGPPSVAPDGELVYTIRFENQATASAPVQELVISDTLSPDLDWTTLRFLDIGYGERQLAIDESGLAFAQRDLPPSGDAVLAGSAEGQLAIDATGSIDPATGRLVWRLQVIDTATGDLPADPHAGFLPPEDGSGRGQGYVTFAIKPRPGLSLGSSVRNTASIVFDTNAAIATNEVSTRIGYPVFLPVVVR